MVSSSSWSILVVAGLLEVAWSVGLKASHGFTRPAISVLTVVAMVASMWLLGIAAKTLPIGTAYGVWVGIGATGAAVLGVAMLGEPISFARAGFMVLLVVSIVGLKMTTPP